MSEASTITQEHAFPEQLRESRLVGTIGSEAFPWVGGDSRNLQVAELTYNEGTIYMVSAGSSKMNAITGIVHDVDKHIGTEGYSRLDQFYLQACHLEAANLTGNSRAVNLVRGIENPDFKGLSVKAWHESPKPNTRRLYYGLTRLSGYNMKTTAGEHSEIEPDANLLIRLGYTDKKHQIDFLRAVTGQGRGRLRSGNAGSV